MHCKTKQNQITNIRTGNICLSVVCGTYRSHHFTNMYLTSDLSKTVSKDGDTLKVTPQSTSQTD